MQFETIFTEKAPKPIGPYSQALAHDNFVFLSGQIPLDPVTGAVVGQTTAEQACQVLTNMLAVLDAAGLDMSAIIKVTVFLVDMADFVSFNTVYEKALGNHKPARSVVQVAALPKNVRIEIEAIACRSRNTK